MQVEASEEAANNQKEQVQPCDAEIEEKARSKGWTMFQRLGSSAAAVAAAVPMSSTPSETTGLQELEGRLREMEEALSREQKCRFLAERKNVLYRNELLRVSQDNAALREQLEQLKRTQQRRDTFMVDSLQLAI
ncbi:hypothetical protein BBO99_00001784 [Phytophthora kernoviae]|uniref:Uncharacterized protein n=2 Tax=Phytophthora kernoviae TaxID=325452 RepID=A0A3R7JAS4_9STRA|nr:hypothetical protein G195_002583 [Phytophthora kernoviae 00238/432]KAG2526117.1 hypothetical protein JM16_004078 [Phytophthora kernoviae]KAG2532081.1 hypothetical protein JM18_001448 [Phytophthora kernoviae]RLN27197.1 hypothetical protein BBI17_001555 [Phytophthora kernoviae]RLN83790.1 hypothetical protein BBO99_00001784 [Phytophthora kernoviae]